MLKWIIVSEFFALVGNKPRYILNRGTIDAITCYRVKPFLSDTSTCNSGTDQEIIVLWIII